MDNMNSVTPFGRDYKKRPEQFIHKLNEERRQRANENSTTRVFSNDQKYVIIQGVQPDGTFGIVKYEILGDTLNEIARVI